MCVHDVVCVHVVRHCVYYRIKTVICIISHFHILPSTDENGYHVQCNFMLVIAYTLIMCVCAVQCELDDTKDTLKAQVMLLRDNFNRGSIGFLTVINRVEADTVSAATGSY